MEIEIGQLVRTVRKLWYLPIVLGLLLTVAGYGAARTLPTTYASTTQILVTAQITGDPVLAADSRTQTYLNLVTSGPVLDRVILELGLEYTRAELSAMIDTSLVRGTQIIEITVTSDDPQLSADIANALARNFVTTATDLSVGEVQRNLDDLIQEANTQQDQLVVIETRISNLDTEENADDSQIQAEIAQLERERIQVSQTLADMNSSIRDLTTNLNTMSIPVVVTDFAQPPVRGQATSPLLLGLLGCFLGGLIGVAWITYQAFMDRTLRAASQVVSLPIFTQISGANIGNGESRAVQMLASRVSSVKSLAGAQSLALVTAREEPNLADLVVSLGSDTLQNFASVTQANGALDNPDALRAVSAADAALVVATINKSSLEDLDELHRVLEMTSTHVLGTVVITK